MSCVCRPEEESVPIRIYDVRNEGPNFLQCCSNPERGPDSPRGRQRSRLVTEETRGVVRRAADVDGGGKVRGPLVFPVTQRQRSAAAAEEDRWPTNKRLWIVLTRSLFTVKRTAGDNCGHVFPKIGLSACASPSIEPRKPARLRPETWEGGRRSSRWDGPRRRLALIVPTAATEARVKGDGARLCCFFSALSARAAALFLPLAGRLDPSSHAAPLRAHDACTETSRL
ncbi:hypothetical protein HPB47_005841 [Ixodes persulcatus]|uniref:Uncharacterized protein n=1 Tax=Ixodes persulcatus TaxID=34615 RepID=A0AC60PBY6_IXOPE|nr:hypothetical protein HPB47_005841 [Ixodes persulcatus]